MSIFGKKEEDYDEEEDLEEVPRYRRIRDLRPENRKKRKEPQKPWGKKERLLILFFFLATIITSGVLAMGARGWKLPGLPRLKITKPSFNFNFFGEETIVIGNKSETNEKARKAEEFFKEKTRPLSGVYALYVLRLEGEGPYGVNEDEVMQAASLIKLPLMATVYIEAEMGKLDLDKAPSGQKRTYRELVYAMGKSSDNEAFRIVRNSLGDEKVSDVIANLGMEKTSLTKNETTPKEIGTFFQKLWNGEIVGEASKKEFLDSLTETIYEDWIAAGIMEVPVAHKYGREVHVVNDAGIVSSEHPFVLVIMSEGVVEKEADEIIPELAAGIYGIEAISKPR